jgi:hypothetical protein
VVAQVLDAGTSPVLVATCQRRSSTVPAKLACWDSSFSENSVVYFNFNFIVIVVNHELLRLMKLSVFHNYSI